MNRKESKLKIQLLDMDLLIKKEGLKPVENPIYFSAGNIPTSDGLFSTEIFGNLGTTSRKNRFAYIDLRGKFLNPVAYKIIASMDTNIDKCINGIGFYKLDNGHLISDEENGDTGIDFIYKIYDHLEFFKSGLNNETRKSKLRLLAKLKRDDVFMDTYPVIPAFLRDFNPSSGSGKMADVDEINDMYSRIIRLSKTISSGTSLSFISVSTKANIQKELVNIYTYLTEKLAHKNGIIHRNLIGKSVDYATRSVITSPRFRSSTWENQEIRFGYTGIPLSQAAVLFYPFFVKFINDFIDSHRTEFTEIHEGNKVIHIDDIEDQFSSRMINRMVDNFIKDEENRFQSIKVHDSSGKEYPIEVYKKELGRNFTITDLLFLAATDICSNKHVYVTRYPIENYRVPRFSITY